MANTLALGASAERLAGSSPAFRTKSQERKTTKCAARPFELVAILIEELPGVVGILRDYGDTDDRSGTGLRQRGAFRLWTQA